jgi:hypothetical protein
MLGVLGVLHAVQHPRDTFVLKPAVAAKQGRSGCQPGCDGAPSVQAVPRVQLPQDRVKALTERIQDAGTEVVKAKVVMFPFAHVVDALAPCMTLQSQQNVWMLAAQAGAISLQHSICSWELT